MYDLLSQLPGEGRHSLEEFCKLTGINEKMEILPRIYSVIPSGRVVEMLRMCYIPRKAEDFRYANCNRDLFDTTHFHIDQNGDLFTGLCAGLVAASVPEFHQEITIDKNPVFHILCKDGPYGLMGFAKEKFGYLPKPEDYISKCDLCIDVRRVLQKTGKFGELRPESFYK